MDRGWDADGSRDKESGPHKAKGEHSTLSSKSGGGDSVSIQKYHLPQPTPPLGQSRSSETSVMGIRCLNPNAEYASPCPVWHQTTITMREGLFLDCQHIDVSPPSDFEPSVIHTQKGKGSGLEGTGYFWIHARTIPSN